MVETAAEQAARAGFFRPGNIVKLKEPYKPSSDDNVRRAIFSAQGADEPYLISARPKPLEKWHAWQGFTHGIIVEVVSTERAGAGGTGPLVPRSVSLHLYDPDVQIIYMGPSHIPTYVDFGVDEVLPWSDAKQLGYVVSDWAVEGRTGE